MLREKFQLLNEAKLEISIFTGIVLRQYRNIVRSIPFFISLRILLFKFKIKLVVNREYLFFKNCKNSSSKLTVASWIKTLPYYEI